MPRLTVLNAMLPMILCLVVSGGAAIAQTTSFTYQGRLSDSGNPANGNYDLQFALFDSSSGGAQIGATQTVNSVSVSGGVFTVQLDFGASAFPGALRFLELSTRLTGSPSFTILSPRQQISSTPYAVRSLNASTADTVTVTGLPGGSGNYIQNGTTQQSGASFNISGNGTAGGKISANIVSASKQYNMGLTPVLTTPFNTNLFVGDSAGISTTQGPDGLGGYQNAFFGYLVGVNHTTGGNNSLFGAFTGSSLTTGTDNTLLGIYADVGSNPLRNATAIGARARVDQSDSMVLGSIAGVNGETITVKVGIGTTTPQTRLDIAATGDGAGLLRFSTERPWVFRQAYTGPGTALRLQPTTGLKNFEITAAAGTNIATFVGDDANPRVGIGTTLPAHRLSVIGGPLWTSSSWLGSMEFSNASAIGWQANTGGWHFGMGQSNGGLYFFQTKSDLGSTLSPVTYDMALTDGGNVGIGTISPLAKLDIAGTLKLDVLAGGGDQALCRNSSFNTIATCSSSLRYKKQITPYTAGLGLINRLQPISFAWKANGIRDLGLGAEDVARVEPLLVTHNDKGEIEGVKYDHLNVILINAIKQQQEQIEALRAQNAALSARLRGVERSLRKRAAPVRRRPVR